MTVTRTGSTATPFGFVGGHQYQSDADSGLQLLGYRYYDPSIGRFLSVDPAKAGTNWWAYCENNPLTSIDPEGLDLQSEILAAVVMPLSPIEKGVIGGSTIIGGLGVGLVGGAAGGAIGSVIPGPGTIAGAGAGGLAGIAQGAGLGFIVGTGTVIISRAIGATIGHFIGGGRPPNMSPPDVGRRGAFRRAKREFGIPRAQPPDDVGPNIGRNGRAQPGRTYRFGRNIVREDSGGADYGPGDPQNRGPHFNPGRIDPATGKIENTGSHYDY